MNSVTYHAATGATASPPSSNADYVCRAIRMYRERLNLSQSQLAAAVDVSGFSVGAWERGESRPSDDEIDRLAARFRVTGVALRFPCSFHLRETVLASVRPPREVR